MPIHDWTKVPAGIFHDFHHEWITAIKHSVNRTLSGTSYYALAEQIAGGVVPDVLTLQQPVKVRSADKKRESRKSTVDRNGAVALATKPPKARFRISDEARWYISKKKSVTIRHVSEHRVVAVLEIV